MSKKLSNGFSVGDLVTCSGCRGARYGVVVDRGTPGEVWAHWSDTEEGAIGARRNPTWVGREGVELIKGVDEMAKFKVGDIIVDEDGDYRKVLGVGNHGYELTDWVDTHAEAEKDTQFDEYEAFDSVPRDWEKSEGIKEVTLEEIADKFNIKVKNLRIKD